MRRMTFIYRIGIEHSSHFKATDWQRVVPKYEFSAADVSGGLPYACVRIKSLRVLAPVKRGAGQALAVISLCEVSGMVSCASVCAGGLFGRLVDRCLSMYVHTVHWRKEP